MGSVTSVARDRVDGLLARESERFVTERPRSTALHARGRSTTRLVEGLRDSIARYGLPWSVTHEGSHAYYAFTPTPPQDGATSRDGGDPDLRALMRVFMANRGVWESGWWLGPTVSVAHTEADVDAYLEVFADFVTTVTS